MDRIKAFLTHMGISLVIFVILAYLIRYQWYPEFHFYTDGGLEGIKLVAGVDLVLGPLLTLCVFKKGKLGLKRDLTLIGLLQLSCLLIGCTLVYNERPVAVIYSDKQIYSVAKEMFGIVDRDAAVLDTLPGRTPKRVYVDFGTDEEHLAYVRRKQHRDGIMQYQTNLYKPYNEFTQIVLDWALSTTEFKELHSHQDQFVDDWITGHGYTKNHIKFVRFSGRYMSGFMGIDSATGAYIDVLANRYLRKSTENKAEESK